MQLKDQLRLSLILAALENIIRYDAEPKFKAAARRRYLELTEKANG